MDLIMLSPFSLSLVACTFEQVREIPPQMMFADPLAQLPFCRVFQSFSRSYDSMMGFLVGHPRSRNQAEWSHDLGHDQVLVGDHLVDNSNHNLLDGIVSLGFPLASGCSSSWG